jgi:hypothetical protein
MTFKEVFEAGWDNAMFFVLACSSQWQFLSQVVIPVAVVYLG